MDSVYYLGLDVHKKTISYCLKQSLWSLGQRTTTVTFARVSDNGAVQGPATFDEITNLSRLADLFDLRLRPLCSPRPWPSLAPWPRLVEW